MPRKNKYKPRPDGRYMTLVQIGYQEDGKPKRVPVYAKTSRELEEAVNALRMEIKNKTFVPKQKIEFYTYAMRWLDTYKAMSAKSTRDMYRNIINKHLTDIHDIDLKDLVKSDVQKIINEKSEHPRICQQIKITVNQIMEASMEDGLVVRNVFRRLTLPSNPKPEKRPLTEEEVQAVKNADFTPKQRAFVYVLFACGLRRGEALALTKNDLDFRAGKIIVNKALSYAEEGYEIKSPKTKSGIREVDMPDWLMSYLRDYVGSLDTILLFPNQSGNLMTHSGYNRFWECIISKMNAAAGGSEHVKAIHHLTAHVFRHNYCTMLYYSGISLKKAAQLMGHADMKMIMEVYAHLDEQKEMTRKKINDTIAL